MAGAMTVRRGITRMIAGRKLARDERSQILVCLHCRTGRACRGTSTGMRGPRLDREQQADKHHHDDTQSRHRFTLTYSRQGTQAKNRTL